MTARPIALMCLSLLVACDPPVLIARDGGTVIADDGGFDTDAGTPDGGQEGGPSDGGLDAGVLDGGPEIPDAGYFDAGPAPPECVFDERPVFEFQCEGDEDFCDPTPSVVALPETDIVATWSRVEGDYVIVEVRLRSFMFRTERTDLRLCLNWIPPQGGAAGLNSLPLAPYHPDPNPWICPGGTVIIGSTPPWAFPLDTEGMVTPAAMLVDPCEVQLAAQIPIVRFVVPYTTENISYQVFSHRRAVGNPRWDVAVHGLSVDFMVSNGGSPDDAGVFVSICDVSCGGAGGREE